MIKVLIEGDSFGLPRYNKLTGCICLDYLNTYPYQLQRMLTEKFDEDVILVNRCRHANTTYSLFVEEGVEIEFLRPDLCVVELGLTDLWPAKGRNIEPLQSELKGNDPWVSCDDYERFIRCFTDMAVKTGSVVEIVGVPMVAPYHLKKHGELERKIRDYSSAAAQITSHYDMVEFVDWTNIADIEQPIIGEDGIHPTAYASRLLAEMLVDGYGKLKQKGGKNGGVLL